MRNETYTLTLNLPNNHVLDAMLPISKGPYMGHDVLMVMNDLCGSRYVVRASLDGKHMSTSEKVYGEEAGMALARKMIVDQSNGDCNAVTGGGRWSCD